jgi:uncharacterized protein (TIGR02301 family)
MMLRSLCTAAILAFALPLPALAQDPGHEPAASGPPLQVLLDLSETLGQAHAIRSLCNGDADQTWRSYMMNMLAIEAPAGPSRAQLTSAFNRGYRGQSSRTPSCSGDMTRIEAQIAARGRQLAETAAGSYLK